MKLLDKAKKYAFEKHEEVNHKYGKYPYRYHLTMVYNEACRFIDLIDIKDRENVLSACYLHDIIEDARETYNDVLKNTNKEVAELVYALTNEKGKNRKERANEKYYQGIRNTKNASFIKLCDRMANIDFSYQNGSSMFEKYKSEHRDFINSLDVHGLQIMLISISYTFRSCESIKPTE